MNHSSLITKNRNDFKPWFEVADSYMNLGEQLADAVRPNQASEQHMYAALLYKRCLMSFQSSHCLAERGALTDARIVVRSAIEASIILFALSKDSSVCNLLLKQDYWRRLKLGSVAIADPEYLEQVPKEDIDVVRGAIAEINKLYPDLKSSDSDPINIFNLAKSAGLSAYYNVIFRWTSGDGVHTTLAGLRRFCITDEHNNVTQFRKDESLSDLPETLHFSMLTFDLAIGAIYTLFKLSEFSADQKECMSKLMELGIPTQYQIPI